MGHLFPPPVSGNRNNDITMGSQNRRQKMYSNWTHQEIRAIVRSVPKIEHSIQRNDFLEQNLVFTCDFLHGGKLTAYRTRFISNEDPSKGKTSLHASLQPGTYIKIGLFRFGNRAGRYEQECIVRNFVISNPEWTWFGCTTQEERDIQFLSRGLNLDCLGLIQSA